jgi:transposase-like protein
MKHPSDPHYRHRFPAEIISHAVWLYHVFSRSLRDGFRQNSRQLDLGIW